MKVLVHTCCGPCLIYPLKRLRDEGHEVISFSYNPNIHPYTEYLKRMDSLERYCQFEKVPLLVAEYDFYDYFHNVITFREKERCEICYHLRLDQAAKKAREEGAGSFTTTLLVSPHQKHDVIRSVGEEIASKHGVPFLYQDFREGYWETIGISKMLGLYRQKYCGCVFSEHERLVIRSRKAKNDFRKPKASLKK